MLLLSTAAKVCVIGALVTSTLASTPRVSALESCMLIRGRLLRLMTGFNPVCTVLLIASVNVKTQVAGVPGVAGCANASSTALPQLVDAAVMRNCFRPLSYCIEADTRLRSSVGGIGGNSKPKP